MLKKITTLTISIFLLIAFSNILVAQESGGNLSDEDIKTLVQIAPEFEGQKAITETEIKKYIELLPKLIESEPDPEKTQALMDESKMNLTRFNYVAMKATIALFIHMEMNGWKENVDKLPEVFKPSKEEMALVAKYSNDIAKLVLE